jgi:CRISPR/Cas system-associated exonuclease Cas4 (RecB family)
LYEIKQQKQLTITIEKDKKVQSILEKYLDHGISTISPTAMISYIECSLRFYFKYVAGIDEPEEVSEVIDAAIFGNLLHLTMKELYEPFKNKAINLSEINAILNNNEYIESILKHAFATQYLKDSKNNTTIDIQGRNIIIYRVLLKYIRQILEIDKQFIPFTINGLEVKYTLKVPVSVSGKQRMVNISGYIDRIDTTRDQIRIIDYKTGSRKESNHTMEQLFNPATENRNTHAMQAYFYAFLFLNNVTRTLPVTPGIYYLRNLYRKFNWHIIQSTGKNEKMTINDFHDIMDPFSEQITKTFESMFDNALPFVQTEDRQRCIYCAFKNICQR